MTLLAAVFLTWFRDIPVGDLLDLYGVNVSKDSMTGRTVLKTTDVEIVLVPGFDVVLINGVEQPLSKPLEISAGTLRLPSAFLSYFKRKDRSVPRVPRSVVPLDRPRPAKNYPGTTILVDPGHAQGLRNGGKGRGGLREKDVTLAVALKTRVLLVKDGFTVVMTRQTDSSLADEDHEDIVQRVKIANRSRPDLLVSIHANWVDDNPSVRGFEVWIPRPSERSRRDNESRDAAHEILRYFEARFDSVNRGIKLEEIDHRRIYLLREVRCPVVMIEMEFLSNPQGERDLGDPAYQQRLAEAIVDGVEAYFDRKR